MVKKYVILRPILPAAVWAFPIETLGLSYLLFRQIHFLVDVLQEQITDFTIWDYANYQLNLFGFLSGPIQRYQEFGSAWSSLNPLLKSPFEIRRAFIRIFVGITKVAISLLIMSRYSSQRTWFIDHALGAQQPGYAKALARFATVFYGYPVYLYFNFSGYCDIVIASAALLGITMPENFDRPYLSRNMIDYWTRFHRTLGFWIRDYLFTPMYKALASRWSEWSSAMVFPCYFVAFVLAGIWHGSTTNFVVFGILHGIGVSANKAWELFLVQRHGRKGLKTYLASPVVRVAAVLTTWNFVSFTMLFFPEGTESTVTLLRGFVHQLIR
jgi:D-alanyl-lipoteichoic acid acyltransferase DltB (MBOAT superfamily)